MARPMADDAPTTSATGGSGVGSSLMDTDAGRSESTRVAGIAATVASSAGCAGERTVAEAMTPRCTRTCLWNDQATPGCRPSRISGRSSANAWCACSWRPPNRSSRIGRSRSGNSQPAWCRRRPFELVRRRLRVESAEDRERRVDEGADGADFDCRGRGFHFHRSDPIQLAELVDERRWHRYAGRCGCVLHLDRHGRRRGDVAVEVDELLARRFHEVGRQDHEHARPAIDGLPRLLDRGDGGGGVDPGHDG